jgi:RNA polymerase sigma-70 factor (ECF subfamily)
VAAAPTDEALVARIRAGDRVAWDALYRRYYARVRGFLGRRLANRADVEEAVQDVFLNVLTSLHGYRGQAPFAAWIFGLTRRTLANRFRKRRIESVPLAEEAAPVSTAPDPCQAYEGQERLERIERAVLRELSGDQRRLFELRHLEHRSIEEIAAETRRSTESVKSHLYRTRRVLLAV